jgi:phosphoglycolate phosphatase-like HAD superfamily hydrolase
MDRMRFHPSPNCLMQALVLDFDGVISDSARESFAVSVGSYLALRPDSSLGERDRDELYDEFVELMPLGNRAEDYGTTLIALESRSALPDQESYDAFRRSQDSAWLERYHRRFYEIRLEMADADLDAWRALMRPYDPFVEILHRRSGAASYAIATAKDRRSVDVLLRAYGIVDLFPPHLIMDKEAGENKTGHLRQLRDVLELDFSEMIFVDDKVNHLDAVAPLGVRCALAAWGYNGRREHELAADRGYLVCRLEDVEQQLFGTDSP